MTILLHEGEMIRHEAEVYLSRDITASQADKGDCGPAFTPVLADKLYEFCARGR